MKNTKFSFTALPLEEISLPPWAAALPDDLVSRLEELPALFPKLRQLGVTHWNSVAQSMANSLKNAGFTESEVRAVLTASGAAYRDEVTPRDIEKVIANAWDGKPTGGKPKWPAFDRAAFAALPVATEADFRAALGPPEHTDPWRILEALFPGDPLLCLATKQEETFQTKSLGEWKKAGVPMNFITPSPMTARTGITLEGKESGRCLDNTGERKYLVIESDELTHDEQWTLISHLARLAPLVMVLDTGNKSLHSWFRCNGNPGAEERFMTHAARLGADKATWNRCQLVRMPGGIHAKTGRPHEVLVFRPHAAVSEQWNSPAGITSTDFTAFIVVKAKPRELIHHSLISFDPVALDFVEDLLTEGGLSVVFAPPGVGKSFFVLDLAACIATGRKWRDKETKGGAVVYFCLEGVQGFRNRILALRRAGLLSEESPLYYVETSLNFLSETDVPGFIQSIRDSLPQGTFPRMIVIDTLARSMAGGNENAGEDMSKAIEGANRLQRELGAHVTLVHHAGKDLSKGSRGHSSLKGAADTEIELSKDERMGTITALVVKQKDLESGKAFPFKLVPVEIGTNERGKTVNSCLVEHLDESHVPKKSRGGRMRKNEPQDLLALLPQDGVSAWEEAAETTLSIPRSRFHELKRQLIDGRDYVKDRDGSLSRVPLVNFLSPEIKPTLQTM